MLKRPYLTRRRVLQGSAALIAAPAVLRLRSAQAAGAFKIGLVSPLTGPLAGFGEAQDWIISGIQKSMDGLTNNGKPVKVEIIAKDSQSSSNRASEVASDLILKDQVNLLLAKDTPDTTNPAADQAELNGVPCISNNCPWQPISLAARAIRPRASSGPIISSGALKTSSPTT